MTRRTSLVRHVVLAALMSVGLSVPAVGQGVGAIGGTIVDESGAVLPGATVTLSSPGTIGGNQTAVSDAQGAYQFTRLVPGRYSVKAELQGFRATMQENINVDADKTSRADLRLVIGAVEEALTVKGEAPLLDTTSALTQTVMAREAFDTLPSANDLWSIARLTPAVSLSRYDVGGREMIGQSTAFTHDGVPDTTTVLVNASTVRLTQSSQTIVVEPRGTTRLPAVKMLDINIKKVVALGKARLEPRIDIFNLLNSSAATIWIAQLGPTYQFPTEILGGRLMKVGANLSW